MREYAFRQSLGECRLSGYINIMIKKFSIYALSFAALAVTLSGCADNEPYVQNTAEYNRDSPTFAKGPVRSKGSEIYICYAKSNATPAQVRAVADEECGRFGFRAVFIGQNYELCPLATPSAAGFTCETQTADVTPSATQPNPFAAPSPTSSPSPIFPKLEVQAPAGAGRVMSPPQTVGTAGSVSTDAKSQPFPTFLFDTTPRTVTPQ